MANSTTGDGYYGANAIYAGRTGDGSVTITSGLYSVRLFEAGVPVIAAPTIGTVTLTGGGTGVTVEDPGTPGFQGAVDVGRTLPGYGPGSGYLYVLDGATLTSINNAVPDAYGFLTGGYNNVSIGRGAGAAGHAIVDGTGSRLLAYGGAARINIGRDGGDGVLTISNGGFVGAFDLGVGRGGPGSRGSLVIDGPGSTFLASAAYGFYGPAYAGAQGFLEFGRGAGSGYLTVTNGGAFVSENVDGVSDGPFLRFGRDNGSYGSAYIGGHDGTGTLFSSLTLTQHGPVGDSYGVGPVLMIGDGGQGVFTVANGGQVAITGDQARLIVADGRYDAAGNPDNTADQSRLVIVGGADVIVDSGTYGNGGGARAVVGNGRETNGAVTVAGAGSTLTVANGVDLAGDYSSGDLVIGRLGTGTLAVSDGAAVAAEELEVGAEAFGPDGYGGTTTTPGFLATVQDAGDGTVNITGGGTLTVSGSDYAPYRGVQIARASGTSGVVNVSGGDGDGNPSTLTSEGGAGMVRVGRYGAGELNISGGGQVNGLFVEIGRGMGSDGRVAIDGPGSVLTVSDAFGHFPLAGGAYLGEAGFMRLGRNDGSYGSLEISNGGLARVINDPDYAAAGKAYGYDNPFVQLGRNPGATGVAVIDGVGSELRVRQYGPLGDAYGTAGAGMHVGKDGTGDVEVRNGGAINVLGAGAELGVAMGFGGPSSGQGELRILSGASVTVDSLSYGGFQTFGDAYSGYFQVSRGSRMIVGGSPGAEGRVVVDGPGSSLNVRADTGYTDDTRSGTLSIGRPGSGELDAANEATVDAVQIFVGHTTAFDGYGNPIAYGTGVLNLTSGADVTATRVPSSYWYGGVRIGLYGGIGTANVAGVGSTLTAREGTARVEVGRAGGTGTLNITDGGLVAGFQVEFGRNGGSGYLYVDGPGSRIVSSDAYGNWNPALYNGWAAAFRLGRNAGSYGKATVTNGGRIELGNESYGGGAYSPSDFAVMDIGREFGTVGRLTVDGAGSAVEIRLSGPSNDSYAPGSGTYYGPVARLGREGGDGAATIRNYGTFTITGENATLSIGQSGDGLLGTAESLFRVETGGSVAVTSVGNEVGATVRVGDRLLGDGRLEIVGPGSTLTVTSDNLDDVISGGGRAWAAAVIVGREGEGDLVVEAGGTIAIDGADDLYPAFIVGRGAERGGTYAAGTATVTGAGSAVTISGANGTYGAAGFIAVGLYDDATGALTVADGGQVTNAVNGITAVGANVGSSGTLTVDGATSRLDGGVLMTIGADYDPATFSVLPDAGGTGLATVAAGGVIAADRIVVGAGGTIAGNGTLEGDLEVLGGTLAPGLSTGALSVTGDLFVAAGSDVGLEVAQFGVPGQFDTLAVGGAATIALGAVALDLPAGAPVPAGSAITLVDAAGDLALAEVDFTAVLLRAFGTVPAIGATTLNGQAQGYLLADTGSALDLIALGDDPAGPAGMVDFGAATADGVELTARNGFGAGSGGGFDAFALLGASAVMGTAGGDVLRLQTTTAVSVDGRGGNDVILTGAGADVAAGGDGDDALRTGLGLDTITLGPGNDLIYGTLAELDGDTVTDFDNLADRIGVLDAGGGFITADISIAVTGGVIEIDVGNDGTVEATLAAPGAADGAVSVFPGPDPSPTAPTTVSVQGAGFVVAEVAEGDTGTITDVTFTVLRGGDLSEEVIVDYEVAGTGASPADAADFATPLSGQVAIPAGSASATVTVGIQGDNDPTESNESFRFSVTAAATAAATTVAVTDGTAFARILDDDVLRMSVADAPDVFEPDSGTVELVFTVFRVGDADGEVTVSYRLTGGPAGEEFDLLADPDDIVGGLPQDGQVVLAPGQTSAAVIVEVRGDDRIEPREDVTLTLTGFSVDGGPVLTDFVAREATGTIRNDDGQPPEIPDGLTAGMFGDPHLVTLDGVGYDFQAVGEFTLLASPGSTNPAFDIPLEVQIRTAPVPGSDLVSQNVAMATVLGTATVMIDATSPSALLIDGVPTTVPPDQGFIPVGDGSVFFDGAVYTIVYATGEQAQVQVFDGFLNVNLFLGEGRTIGGLLGNGDGDPGNEFALRDGTALGASLTFDELYGAYADSWRVTDATSLFTYPAGLGTADFSDPDFPAAALAVEDLPAALVAAATEAAAGAGITDPLLLEAAILDFALTGDMAFAAGAAEVAADPITLAVPTAAPPVPTSVGITVAPATLVEGDSGATDVVFTLYRLGDASAPLSVDYVLGGDIDLGDLGVAALSGTMALAPDQTVASLVVPVLGDTEIEDLERLTASISVDPALFPGVLIAAPRATARIETDDLAPASLAIAALTAEVAEGTGTGGVARFEITRSGDISGASTVEVAFGPAGDAPASGADFDGGSFPATIDLAFAPGETSKIVEVALAGDGEAENNETFEARLENPSGAGIATASAVVVILDDDGAIIGTDGDDEIVGTNDPDVIFGNDGDDTIRGRQGDDVIEAGAGDDTVKGERGDDLISGGSGNDTLKGGRGDDTIVGGPGDDVMFGGADADIFVLTPGGGVDRVQDFEPGEDMIDVTTLGITAIEELDISGRGRSTIIDYGDGELWLRGVLPDDLGPDSFIFDMG